MNVYVDAYSNLTAANAGGATTVSSAKTIQVEISAGELLDKITILEIKNERMDDARQLQHIRCELDVLRAARDRALTPIPELARCTEELKTVNEKLWDIEDEIRECERQRDFGPRFVELARAVYRHNDRRSAIKRAINELAGSRIVEQKSYRPYD